MTGFQENATQEQFVEDILLEDGEISRNYCLSRFITRLGAIIWKLKDRGYEITGQYVKTATGKDFIYKLIN